MTGPDGGASTLVGRVAEQEALQQHLRALGDGRGALVLISGEAGIGKTALAVACGERARAALARVLAQDTHVLLLDEPTAALDLRHQEQVLTVAGRLAAEGRAVAVVMHDLGLAAAHADRVAVLCGGRILAEGPPGAVLTSELLSHVYECPIEVLRHPRTDALLVVPQR